MRSSPNIIRISKSKRMKLARNLALMRDKRSSFEVLVKSERKGPLGRHRRRYISMAVSGPRPLIEFRNLFSQTVGLLGRMICSSKGRYLNTG
jgi:hypothetical protein